MGLSATERTYVPLLSRFIYFCVGDLCREKVEGKKRKTKKGEGWKMKREKRQSEKMKKRKK